MPSRSIARRLALATPKPNSALAGCMRTVAASPRDNLLAALFFGMAAEQGHEYAKKMRAFYGPTVAKLPNCMIDREPGSPPPYALDMAYGPEGEFVPANAEQKQIAEMVRKIAPQFKISPQFALAVIRAESNFDPNARSPKNAQGLMQLIPETAARFNVKKPYDPAQNVRGGLAYLRWLLAYFEGNVPLVLAAYNAGEKAVDKYKGVPPYQETRAYVRAHTSLLSARASSVRRERHRAFTRTRSKPRRQDKIGCVGCTAWVRIRGTRSAFLHADAGMAWRHLRHSQRGYARHHRARQGVDRCGRDVPEDAQSRVRFSRHRVCHRRRHDRRNQRACAARRATAGFGRDNDHPVRRGRAAGTRSRAR